MKRFFFIALFLLLSANANALVYEADVIRLKNKNTLPSGAPESKTGTTTFRSLSDGRMIVVSADGSTSSSLNIPNTSVVIVGPAGDSTTVAGGITIATARGGSGTILVNPGTYAEQSLEIPDGWSLVGVDREKCIISMASTNYDSVDARTSALVSAPGNSLVANLTINNTRSSYPSTALNLGYGWSAGTTSGKSPRAVNCVLRGAKEDILYTSGENTIIVSGCQVFSTGGGDVWSSYSIAVGAGAIHRVENSYLGAEGAGSPAAAFWMKNTGRCEIYNCRVRSDASSASRGAFRFADTGGVNGSLHISNCRVEGQTGLIGNILEAQTTGAGWSVYVNRTASTDVNTVVGVTVAAEDFGDNDAAFGGDVDVTGDFAAGASDFFSVTSTAITLGAAASPAVRYSNANNYLEFDDGGGSWDVNLYHDESDPNLLVTDDTFNAGAGLQTGGTPRIDGSGNTTNLTIPLDQLSTPSGDKSINLGNNSLSLNWVAPSGAPTYDGAFEIQANGAFVGDLMHVHQHTGNPGTTDLAHFEASDADVTGVRISANASADALVVASGNAKINGPLTVDNSSLSYFVRSGLTSGSGVATVVAVVARYTSTPSADDGPVLGFYADDGSLQQVGGIWAKKIDGTNGKIEIRDQTSDTQTLSAHSQGGVFYTDITRWRDFSAIGSAQGWVTKNLHDAGADGAAWYGNSQAAPTHLVCGTDGETVQFPVPYEPGSTITQVRVKWQAQGDADGVKIRILKRDESGTATAWTVVGAQQTYTDAGAPYDVTVSTYDVADEALSANTSYIIEVESEKAATGSNLFSVGIETSTRAY